MPWVDYLILMLAWVQLFHLDAPPHFLPPTSHSRLSLLNFYWIPHFDKRCPVDVRDSLAVAVEWWLACTPADQVVMCSISHLGGSGKKKRNWPLLLGGPSLNYVPGKTSRENKVAGVILRTSTIQAMRKRWKWRRRTIQQDGGLFIVCWRSDVAILSDQRWKLSVWMTCLVSWMAFLSWP